MVKTVSDSREFEYVHHKVLMRLKLIFGLASEVIPIIIKKYF